MASVQGTQDNLLGKWGFVVVVNIVLEMKYQAGSVFSSDSASYTMANPLDYKSTPHPPN